MTHALPSAIQQQAGANSNLRVGIVQSITSATRIVVNIGGGIIDDIPFLSSYSPAVGDNVNLVRYDATWLALGIVGLPGLAVVRGTVTSSTVALTTSAAVELDLPFLASQEPVVVSADHIYEMYVRCPTGQSVATDFFQWRVRRDTAVSGQELGFQRFSNNSLTTFIAREMTTIFEATADEAFDVFWSVQRIGTSTGTITMTPSTNTTRAYMKVTDLGLNTTVTDSPWSETT